MPKEFCPPLSHLYFQTEHIGQRFWIVPNDRLQVANLIGRSIPEDKQKQILLLSGVLQGFTAGRPRRPVFGEFQNKDGNPVKKTAGTYPDESVHTYFPFEGKEIGTIATRVSSGNVAKALGVHPNMLENNQSPLPSRIYSSSERRSTNLLFETLTDGENKRTLPQILDRTVPPNLTVVKDMPVGEIAACHLVPKGSSYRVRDGKTNVYYFKDSISLLIESSLHSKHIAEKKNLYAELLLERGADPSNALVLAIAYEDVEFVKLLLDSGADPNTVRKCRIDNTVFLTTPLKVALPQTACFHSKYYQMNRNIQLQAWANMEAIVDELLKTREFVEQDGTRILVDSTLPPETETILIEPYISPTMLEELQDRLRIHTESMEKAKQIPQKKAYAIEWYEAYDPILRRILAKIQNTYELQQLRPGKQLFEQARQNAVALGFHNTNQTTRQQNEAFASMKYTNRNKYLRRNRRTHRNKN